MHIYFLGICGTAMGNAALLLKERGCRVSGADSGVYPPMSDVLRSAGIEILEGFEAARLEALGPDLVVVGNSTVRGNTEFEWLLAEKRVPFTSLPALLHERLLTHRKNLVVSGTHGKTTTATLAAVLLKANGADAGYFIGGVPRDLPAGATNGSDDAPFVIEGDEYDSALFDKRSKFIHYAPHIAVVNNLEFDHADIFRDLADVRRSFNHFLKIVPRNGFILLNGDDENVATLDATPWTTTCRVGTSQRCDLRIEAFRDGPEGSSFDLVWRGRPWGTVVWGQGGLYNARNAAMAALGAALLLRGEEDVTGLDLSALTGYQGVKRRQERLIETDALTVLEDFGHHPTALENILESLRDRFPGRTLTAVFQPGTNTTRRDVVREGLIRALLKADEAYLGPIDRPEKVSDAERLDLPAVVSKLREGGVKAQQFPSNGALLETLVERTLGAAGPPRVVTFFTNGAFDGIVGKYVAAVREAKR
jgi:UDP-N-acetylmuramate: L-alanyl-gamma-D-glutamyl-meso-diaminopimelate ligase